MVIRPSGSQIQSVIIQVIKKKSDNHEAGVQFVKHMYDYQQNEMTQSPVTNE